MDVNYSYANEGVVVRFTSPTTLPVNCTVSIMNGMTTVDSVEANQGSSTIFIEGALTAGTYYVSVVGNGVVGTSSPFTVSFAQTYTIVASAGTGGSISPSGNVSVFSGESKEFTITANSGYSISSVTVDGMSKGVITSYTFSNVAEEHTISATFTANPGPTPTTTHTIVASAGTGGSISPSGTSTVTDGSSKTFTVITDSGYGVDKVLVDGSVVILTDGKYTFSNVAANHTISVSFKALMKETITVEVTTDGGSISPSGSFDVDEGSSQTFTLTPEDGFKVDKVTVNGNEVSLDNNKFTVDNITSDLEIQVSFISDAPISGNDNTMIIIILVIVMILIISGTAYYLLGVKKQP